MISKSRDKQKKQKLSVMLRNSQRLLTLINQLLELSRFDSKKTQLQANCQNIVSYLKDIAASFDELARKSQLKLEFYSSQEDIPLYFEPPRLEQVMYNLLMNAILVVEDDADVRKFICDPLKPGYRLVEAADGKEGIEKAKEVIPDLIVSDIMMPEVDGYELCRQLKQDIETSHIPIMLLTAKASEESILQGLKTGANDYITKPFNAEILLSRIKNLIDLRTQMQLKLQRQDMRVPDEIPVSSLDVKFLREFREIIEKNLSDPEFRVEDIYEKLKVPRSTFFRKIKALTGNNPNQFILDYRLERGAQLLREKYGSVTEVAMAVGFNSSAYFSKCFKDKFHMSPTSYQASESKSS